MVVRDSSFFWERGNIAEFNPIQWWQAFQPAVQSLCILSPPLQPSSRRQRRKGSGKRKKRKKAGRREGYGDGWNAFAQRKAHLADRAGNPHWEGQTYTGWINSWTSHTSAEAPLSHSKYLSKMCSFKLHLFSLSTIWRILKEKSRRTHKIIWPQVTFEPIRK